MTTYTTGSVLVNASLSVLSDGDTGSAADLNFTLAVALVDLESGSGADAGEAVVTTTAISDAESGTATESNGVIATTLVDTEAGVGVELATISTALADVEAGTLADVVALVNQAFSDADSGIWTEGGGGSSYASTIAGTTGLVGYWKTDEASGNLVDSGSNGITLTKSGTVVYQATGPVTSGSPNYAVDISGAAGYFDTAAAGGSPLDIANTGMSVEMWVKASGTPGTFKYLLSRQSSYLMYTGNDGRVYFAIDTGGDLRLSPFGFAPWDANWHHIVGVYDNTSGSQIRIYVDGVESGTATTGNGLRPAASSDHFRLGDYNGDTTNAFNFPGSYAHVAIYNVPLSPAQVASHYSLATASAGPAESIAVSLTDVEAGSVADTESVNTGPGTVPISDADAGAIVDLELSLAAGLLDTESGSAAEVELIAASVSEVDSASSADAELSVNQSIADADTGTWVEGTPGTLGGLVRQATPFASTGDATTHVNGAPALPATPTVGNTDILCAASSATVTTPAGYTRDTFDATFAGIYIFRRTVQAGDTGAAFNLSLGANRPLWCGRYELNGTAAVDVVATSKNYNSTTTTARSSNALVSTATGSLLYFATDQQSTARTWSSITPAGLVQIDTGAPTGGTAPYNGVTIYKAGQAAGTNTLAATSNVSTTRYQIIGLSYTFTGVSGPAESIAAAVADTEAGAVADTESVDTGSGTFPLSDADTGSIADLELILASALTDTEVGSSTETELLSPAPSDTESATLADTAVVAAALTDADNAIVDDQGTVGGGTTPFDNDSVTIVDAGETLASTISDAEAATVADAESILATEAKTDTEAASAADAGAIAAALNDAETGSVLDTESTLTSPITDGDIGTGVDTAVMVNLSDADSAVGVDTVSVFSALINDSDFATVLELEGLLVSLNDIDTAVANDAVGFLAQFVSDGDFFIVVDAGEFVSVLAVSELAILIREVLPGWRLYAIGQGWQLKELLRGYLAGRIARGLEVTDVQHETKLDE